MHTDGSFSLDVKVPAGGSVEPATAGSIAQRRHYLDVADPQRLKTRLDPVSLDNFHSVAQAALDRSGASLGDVDYLCGIHLKPSMQRSLEERLGLHPDRAARLRRHRPHERRGPAAGTGPGAARRHGEAGSAGPAAGRAGTQLMIGVDPMPQEPDLRRSGRRQEKTHPDGYATDSNRFHEASDSSAPSRRSAGHELTMSDVLAIPASRA